MNIAYHMATSIDVLIHWYNQGYTFAVDGDNAAAVLTSTRADEDI